MTLDISAHGIRDTLDRNPVVGEQRTGARRFWTGREEKILREAYPHGGVPACLPLLPGRTASSIYNRAGQLGLRSTPLVKKNGFPRERWTSNEQIDRLIVEVYQRAPKKNDVNRLAATINRPRYWVSARSRKLGCVSPRFRQPPWTEAEDDIIAAWAARSPAAIARRLKANGFARTETAIVVRLKRLGQPRGRNADVDHYTANALAKLFGIDRKGVGIWIAKGWLKAGRRGTDRHSANGGDEFWIHRRDIRRFVIENPAAVDLRKVEKLWFIEMLAETA